MNSFRTDECGFSIVGRSSSFDDALAGISARRSKSESGPMPKTSDMSGGRSNLRRRDRQ